jgi:hypothetical protein
MTKVVIIPKLAQDDRLLPASKKTKANTTEAATKKEWSGCFGVQFDASGNDAFFCDQYFKKCNTLTSVELISTDENTTASSSLFNGKYLAQIQALRSPMQSLQRSSKSSNSVQLTKFLQSIENSYPSSFYHNPDYSNNVVYAMLNVVNFNMEAFDKDTGTAQLKVSNFLRNQLKFFEYGSKVLVKAQSIDSAAVKTALSSSTRKTVILKPNRSKNVTFTKVS